MKNPVYINQKDIDMSVIPAEIAQKIKNDADERMYVYLKYNPSGTDDYYKFKHNNERQYLNELLTVARPRMDLFDHNCQLILTAEDYNRLEEDMAEQGREFRDESLTMNIRILSKDGSARQEIPVDAGIYHHIQNMHDMGYATAVCCSGMLADHPNYRYVEDSEHGLYVKGEPICWNKQGSVAYIGFYKQDENRPDLPGNTPQEVDDIRRVAEETGWLHEDSEIYGRPAVVLRLPVTLDGTGKQELLDEGRRLVNLSQPGLFVKDFMKALQLRSQCMPGIYANHGGVVMYNDKMLKRRWSALSMGLALAADKRKDIAAHNGEIPTMTRIDNARRSQIGVLLERLGIALDHHALDRHVPSIDGNYSNVWLQIKNGKAYCPPGGFDETQDHLYEYMDFNKQLVKNIVSDIVVSEKNGKPYISCAVLGNPMPAKEMNSGSFTAYAMGALPKEDLAWFFYSKEIYMLGGRQQIKVSDGYGHVERDGDETYYHGESNGNAILYKDNKAFSDKQGVCYISQTGLQKYAEDMKEGIAKPITTYGDTWQTMIDKIGQVYPVSTEKVAAEIFGQLQGEPLEVGISAYKVMEKERQAAVQQATGNNGPIVIVGVNRLMPYSMAQKVLAEAGLLMPENKDDIKGLEHYDEYHLEDDMDISKMMPRNVMLSFKGGQFQNFSNQISGLLPGISKDNAIDYQYVRLHEIHDAQRLTDLSVYTGTGGRLFFRCKIDGEQRPGQQIPDNLTVKGPDGPVLKEPAVKQILDFLHYEMEGKWRKVLGTLPEVNSQQNEEPSKGFKR